MSETSSGPGDLGDDSSAEPGPQPAPQVTPDPADTEHPVGEEQAQRNIEQEPPG